MNRVSWLVLLLLAGCSRRSTDADVYFAVIRQLSAREAAGRVVQVEPTTRFSPYAFAGSFTGQDLWIPVFRTLQKEIPEVSPDLLESFKAANLQPSPLKDCIAGRSDIVLGELGQFSEASPSTMWGRITVSGIGFNRTRTNALVYAHVWTTDKTGGWYLLFLEHREEAWRVRSCCCLMSFAE